jgi:hypothetical protein
MTIGFIVGLNGFIYESKAISDIIEDGFYFFIDRVNLISLHA